MHGNPPQPFSASLHVRDERQSAGIQSPSRTTPRRSIRDARQWPQIFCQWNLSAEERERRRPENDTYRDAFRDLADDLDKLTEPDAAEIRRLLNELEHRYDLVRGTLRRPITLALTGLEIDPDVALLVDLLGPAEAAARLHDIL